MLTTFIKQEFTRNPLTRLAALAALPVLNRFKRRVDPRRYNGAALLGLRGLVFKSHGSADAFAFEHALASAHDAAQERASRPGAGAHPRDVGRGSRRGARDRQLGLRRLGRLRRRPIGMTTAPARYSRITGTGSYLPPDRVSNADLAARLARDGIETSDEWIVERTGIRFRHFAAPDVTSSDLALIASQRALAAADCDPGAIDLIIVATSTPDMVFPSAACLLQRQARHRRLPGVRRPGGVLGIRLRAGDRRFDDQDRRRVEGARRRRRGVLAHPRLQGPHDLRAVRRRRRRRRPRGERNAGHPRDRAACRRPPRRASSACPATSRAARSSAIRCSRWTARRCSSSPSACSRASPARCSRRPAGARADIDWLIPHQANIRIMQSTAKKLKLAAREADRRPSTGTATRRRRRSRSRSTRRCAPARSGAATR